MGNSRSSIGGSPYWVLYSSALSKVTGETAIGYEYLNACSSPRSTVDGEGCAYRLSSFLNALQAEVTILSCGGDIEAAAVVFDDQSNTLGCMFHLQGNPDGTCVLYRIVDTFASNHIQSRFNRIRQCSETSHVIPALIRKCVEARLSNASEIVLWGDGSPTREFLYVDDAARAVVAAARQYDKPDAVNIGSGVEISIRDLAATIASHVGFRGRVIWDTTKPNGQPRRCLDVTRAETEFGFRARTSFEVGLRSTVDWYLAEQRRLAA